MADRVRIMCIVKRGGHFNPHERIESVGGFHGGSRWKITEQEAINGIHAGKWSFFVHNGGREVDVIVAKAASGREYLKTRNDNYLWDNLLQLPDCPV